MPLDPQLKAFLDRAGAAASLSNDLSVSRMRARFQNARAQRTETVAKIEEHSIRSANSEIALRIYYPDLKGLQPALLFLHGGGWVLGGLDQQDGYCRALTNAAGVITVAADYRLAPEHKFPCALEDSFAALRWVVSQSRSLGVDPSRIAVSGTSAGANLAAALCLFARDRSGPPIAFQLLAYPPLDLRPDSFPEAEDANNPVLNRRAANWFVNQYVADLSDRSSPYASPLLADDLSKLPAAFIMTAELDPLRDEAEEYARRLHDAKVQVVHKRYAGMTHMFLSFVEHVDGARSAFLDAARSLRAALHNGAPEAG